VPLTLLLSRLPQCEAGSGQCLPQVTPVNVEALADCDQVEAGLVETTGGFELLRVQGAPRPPTARDALSFEMSHDGVATNAETFGQLIDLGTVRSGRNQGQSGLRIQFPLLAARRSDGSSGRSITTLTSKDPFETGDAVWVGIAAQELDHYDNPNIWDRGPDRPIATSP
jgi:hypothetical protein